VDSDKIDEAVQKEMQQVSPFLNGESHDEDVTSGGIGVPVVTCPHANSTMTTAKTTTTDIPDICKQHLQEHVRRRRLAIMFIMCYRQQPPEISTYANLLDDLVAFEEAFLLWRTRHVRMVERMIGRRTGTGGSSGVDYLEGTTKYRVFLDLWQAKAQFIRTTALPRMTLLPFDQDDRASLN